MNRILWPLMLGGLVAVTIAHGQSDMRVKVTGEKINLRAKASLECEVVGQALDGDVLSAKSIRDDWVEIMPPAGVDLWVHRDFVKDSAITGNKVFVRGGPGINYSAVGTLARGDTVETRGEFGEWIKIAPPRACSLWVSRQFVQVLQPEKPAPPPPPANWNTSSSTGAVTTLPAPARPPPAALPPPIRPSVTVAEPKPEAFAPPADLDLIPLEGQGRMVQREGELRLVGIFSSAPSRFRLMRAGNRGLENICYVRGNSSQLSEYVGRRMLIRGREYWVQGERFPVVIPEQIIPRAEDGR